MGVIHPNICISAAPTESSALADALFLKVRQRVLAVLFGTPDRGYYANEVIALAQSGTGAGAVLRDKSGTERDKGLWRVKSVPPERQQSSFDRQATEHFASIFIAANAHGYCRKLDLLSQNWPTSRSPRSALHAHTYRVPRPCARPSTMRNRSPTVPGLGNSGLPIECIEY
jgi:hypothetical protein